MSRLKFLPLSALLSLLIAGPSAAIGLAPDQTFTLDAPVAFSITGASGSLNPYDPLLEGELAFVADAICLSGGTACTDNTNWASQDWVVFRVSVTTGTLDEVGFAALFVNAVANGYFQNLGGTAPTSGDATTNPDTPTFLFSSLSGLSAPLFVAYPNGLPSSGGPFGTGASNFMVRLGGTAQNFMGVVTTVIPEPGTFLLLGSGLIGLIVAGRRSSF